MPLTDSVCMAVKVKFGEGAPGHGQPVNFEIVSEHILAFRFGPC